ncbi:DegT/DnrJ/EryC1/StrS family aminotransferase [candidate division KSB1 bacterium]|nr:MAG: DegT/DnrJ/EryC1/StrS family aminotransferase [candidate division KSB1 bacterium]
MSRKLWRVGREELQYIEEVINSGLSGAMNSRFEEAFAAKFGVKYAIGVNSGTSALHCALSAVGVEEGNEVIVPPLTFAAPALAVLHQRAIPVFADVDPETFTIDPEDIKKKITERTKAIIPVALYGLPADMDPIMELAEENGIKVIEDNAECFLGKYKGRVAGTLGHMAIYSFERSKHMTSGNGGVITTDDEMLAERARKFSILGYTTLTAKQASYKVSKDEVQHPEFKRHELVGYNYRLPEVCAAMALAQLEKLDMFIEKRRKIAAVYGEAVEGCPWLKPQKVPKGYVHSYWTYAMKLEGEEYGISWMDFRRTFLEEGGERFYAAWCVNYLEPAFQKIKFLDRDISYREALCPVAEKLQKSLIQLKTNFEDLEYARFQADALRRTIEKLSQKTLTLKRKT